jgi:protein MpaA
MIFTELPSGRSLEHSEIKVYKSDRNSKKFIYLLAGINGRDVEGVYLLEQLFVWLFNDHSMPDLPLIIVPIINPDGYRAGTLENSHGVNLTHNFITDKSQKNSVEPEVKFLMELFHKYKPGMTFIFSSGNAKIQYDTNCKEVASFLSKLNSYDIGLRDPEVSSNINEYLNREYSSSVINFLCPKISEELTLKDLWSHNEKCLKDIFMGGKLDKILKE